MKLVFGLLSFILLSSCAEKLSLVSLQGENNSGFESPMPTKPDEPVNPNPPTVPDMTVDYSKKIQELAGASACGKVNWIDRGRSPIGYTKGMALTFARSLCRVNATAVLPAAHILQAASSGLATKDVLAHYQDILAALRIQTSGSGNQAVQATYSIGMGLGMKESSGQYCEGWDVAAGSNRESAEAEAGIFQASYDSMRASPELRALYEEYKVNPERCSLSTFKEGVSCKATTILGSGAGAEFQEFVKKCPAFATEYAMTLIRILRAHFGPLNRKTAEVNPACVSMLNQTRQIVETNLADVCEQLL